MKIARLYLEDDDPMLAESYINRASLLQVMLIEHRCYFFFTITLYFIRYRLNPKMKNCKSAIKCATHGYWITVVSLSRPHKGTTNCRINQL